MQVNDVRGLEFRENGDVRTGIGNVDSKEVVLLEAIFFPYKDAFPNELPYSPPISLQLNNAKPVGLFFPNQHLGLNSIVLQCFHQASGSDGGASYSFGCIDDKYSHSSLNFYKVTE
jgi:hypothetical protein